MQMIRRRRGFIIGVLSLGLLAGVALTASPAQAVTSNGPYYAEPAWDQKLDAAMRFVVLSNWNNEAVLDRETGLVWEQAPNPTQQIWDRSINQCLFSRVGGRMGWRLPSISELASLIDPSVASPGPTLPVGHPFSNVSGPAKLYWSATTRPDEPLDAFAASFEIGAVSAGLKASLTLRAWCVRGGMNADAY
ncbi:DUF1566 domain-containing protein [Nitrospira sp. NS4]|uniref:Lcl C-terminal domain-containing protein n=1 Tax=Nitrospira sp. NS4 TaxID=3414498 RepID=UPI003C2D441D